LAAAAAAAAQHLKKAELEQQPFQRFFETNSL
jgi:hypothetical protein